MKTPPTWFHREPTLDDMLSESIVEAMMRADGVDPHELKELLRRIARSRTVVAE